MTEIPKVQSGGYSKPKLRTTSLKDVGHPGAVFKHPCSKQAHWQTQMEHSNGGGAELKHWGQKRIWETRDGWVESTLDSSIHSCVSSGCCCCLYHCERHYGTGASTRIGECPGWACHQAVGGKSEVELLGCFSPVRVETNSSQECLEVTPPATYEGCCCPAGSPCASQRWCGRRCLSGPNLEPHAYSS